MTPDTNQSLRVCPISSDGRAVGLDLAFSRLPPEERKEQIDKISTLAPNAPSGEGLFGAYRDRRLVGAAFSLIQPGKTAQIWLPCLVENHLSG